MPYKAKGKCVYRKDTEKKVGCTKGSVKKYLAALHANVKDVNESEDSLNWADNINIMLGFDDLEVGNLVKLKDYDNNVWQVTDIYMTNPAMTGKPSEKRIKFKSSSKNSYLELWKSPLNSSEYFELMSDRFNIMKESEDDLNWADDANLTPIKDDEERYKLIFDTLSKIKYKNYSVYQDKFDGVVYWNGLPGGYTGMATPEWENPFEVPIDVMWNQGNDYDNVGIIKTPEFRYVEELVDWYSKDYFEKVSKTLENFIEFGDTPGIIESHINESEFDWLETPELPEDNDFISSVKYALEGSPYELIEKGNLFDSKFTMVVLHKKISQLGNSTGDSLVIKKRENFTPKNVKFEFDNVFNNLKNQEKLLGPGGISHNPRTFPDLFSKIEKLRTLYFGAYELIKDLLPKDGLNESEDFGDLNWADEINPLDFSYQGKEFFFDIRELNREELGKLYNLLLPYMNKTGKFINHMGEEISWHNNTTCFQNLISTSSRGTITSISLHCGINDNDYLPLEGAICCLSGTYENEPDKSNIIYINAKDLFDYTINESEWFEDVANEPIILKTEELEVGDVVIPTCFKEEEFIVTGKGTSVKLLHEPTHWVTLKRNTKTDMGGVFLEHDTEMGRNCRFTLVHRENLIEESEENDDLFWADEMLKSYDDSIDITGDSEQLSNLKPGDFLKITGYQDNLDIDNDCKIVDFGVKSGRSPKYLVKFKKEIRTDDGSDVTHCGPYDRETGGRIEKDCDCRRATPDDEPHSSNTVGKCWFVDLNHMDKVLWYPNRHGLVENKKIEKPLLIEGRYDTITRKVVKDIINFVTSKRKGSFSLPYDMTDEFEYEQEGLSFSIDLDIKKNRGVKDFYLDAAVSDDKDENVIMVALFFGPDFSPKSYEKLFYRLQEVMRHEIEHLTQGGPNRIPDRPIYYGSTSDLKTVYGHHKNKIEVPALVHGFYRRAKIEKRPLDEIMIDDLDADIQKGLLSKKQAENLLTIWLGYAKKNLPAARYSK